MKSANLFILIALIISISGCGSDPHKFIDPITGREGYKDTRNEKMGVLKDDSATDYEWYSNKDWQKRLDDHKAKKVTPTELQVEGPTNNQLRVIIEDEGLLNSLKKQKMMLANNRGTEKLIEEIIGLELYHNIKDEKAFDVLIISFKDKNEVIQVKDKLFIYQLGNTRIKNFRNIGTQLRFPMRGNLFIGKENQKDDDFEEVLIEHLSSHCQLIIRDLRDGFLKNLLDDIDVKIFEANQNTQRTLNEEKAKSERARLKEKYSLE